MRLLLATLTTIAVQLLLAAALYGGVAALVARAGAGDGGIRRRWIVAWSGAARALLSVAPWAAATLVVALALAARAPGAIGGLAGAIWFDPGWFLALGAVPTAGCYLVLQAGRVERLGRLRAARVRARLGGELTFVGVVALLVFVWIGLLFRVPVRRALVEGSAGAGLYLLGGMLCLGCAAFIAVTAGLAGKPRPSCWFASLLYTAGLAGLVLAFQTAV